MSYRTAIVLALALCIGPASASLAAFDGSKPFLCAITEAVECDDDGVCERGSAEDINAPAFIQIDVKSGRIREHGGGSRSTEIQSHQRMGGRLILQGVQERAWSVSISEETGDMTMTAAGDRHGIVVFGACTEL